MPKLYFTYGTDPAYPFRGGWTEITAPSLATAYEIFRAYHPNCPVFLSVLTEDEFLATGMLLNGHCGAWCQEGITVSRNVIAAGDTAGNDEQAERTAIP